MSFLGTFDPANETHVRWLKEVDDAMSNATTGQKIDFQRVVNANPMGAREKNIADWAYTHFQLCMRYTQAVLRGKAYVPTQSL